MIEKLNGFEVKKSFHELPIWLGIDIKDTYGGKTVLDYNGTPLFAELFVLHTYYTKGFDGVWADTFRRRFRTQLPEQMEAQIQLPAFVQRKLDQINPKGKLNGTWDLILWKENQIKFVELKRKGKDCIRQTQIKFLNRALNSGLSIKCFEIFEWAESKE